MTAGKLLALLSMNAAKTQPHFIETNLAFNGGIQSSSFNEPTG